jgi:hypothetical protein
VGILESLQEKGVDFVLPVALATKKISLVSDASIAVRLVDARRVSELPRKVGGAK